MRIGIDARLNGYRESGVTEYTRQLIGALAVLDRVNEYNILHAKRRTRLAPELVTGPNFRRVMAITPSHHPLERFALAGEILRLQLDVLHSPDFIPPRLGAHHMVISVHDLSFLHARKFKAINRLRYYNRNIRTAVRDADHIMAGSQAIKHDLQKLLNVPAEKITVNMPGIGPEFCPLPPEAVQAVRCRLALPSTYLLFVGTMDPHKNLSGLLQAYSLLRAEMADTPPLVIVRQRGRTYKTIYKKSEALNLADQVRWLEHVPRPDLPAIYNGAAALVVPSLYDWSGQPALEAIACGIPTVVANRGALPEIVGSAGLLVDPDQPDSLSDALRRILSDETLRQESQVAGLSRAATFTWQRAARIALSVYQRVNAS
jgi:glycosyltransferase involved in cell wall biosynthesis